MRKILGRFRPYALSILAIFVLLFVMTMTDLELPTYMGNIVNIGLQQSGIEEPVPEALRESTHQALSLFWTEEENQRFDQAYRLISQDSATEKEKKTYAALEKEGVYVLDQKAKPDREGLAQQFTDGSLILAGLDQAAAEQQLDRETLLAAYAQLPEDQRAKAGQEIAAQLSTVADTLRTQAACAFTAQEQEASGLPNASIGYILRAGCMMLLFVVIGAACSVLVGYLSAKSTSGFALNLRGELFRKVESFSGAEIDRFTTASLITRTTNDVMQVQMFALMFLRMVLMAPIMAIGGVIKALDVSTSMWWVIGVAVAALLLLILIIYFIVQPKFDRLQKLLDRLNQVSREMLTGIMVVRAFNRQKEEEEKFDVANRDLTRLNLSVNRVMTAMFPLIMLIMNGATLLIVWVGADQVAQSSLQVGDMLAFIQYAMQIIMSFLMLSFVFIMLPRAVASAKRIQEVPDAQPSIRDPEKPAPFLPEKTGLVEFRDVTFSYPGGDLPILEHITFTAKPGETTAIIGSTGCGKSTLVQLIPRFYDVSEGQVLVDGADVRQVPQEELRRRIGYVPQKGVLFTGTIESNILYGCPEAGSARAQAAAATAQAADFIQKKEEGYQSEIAQGGTNVSGGQKQRLAIARALAVQPEIYVFDDSFSALDYQTDAALRHALKEETAGATLIIVAQRIGTIMDAEQILVLDEGKIVGKGTHRQLLDNCPVYREIALSQLSEEELVS